MEKQIEKQSPLRDLGHVSRVLGRSHLGNEEVVRVVKRQLLANLESVIVAARVVRTRVRTADNDGTAG